MHFDVFKHFNLSLEVTVTGDLQKIAEQLNPELVVWVRFEDGGGDIISEGVDDLEKVLGSLFFLYS